MEAVAKKGIRSIASGLDHCLALGLDGRVFGWFVREKEGEKKKKKKEREREREREKRGGRERESGRGNNLFDYLFFKNKIRGFNQEGQLGVGTEEDEFSPVEIRGFFLFLFNFSLFSFFS